MRFCWQACYAPLRCWAQEAPPLKTAVDGTFAPHAMPKLGGGYEGFNIDLAEEIAKRLKRKSTIDALQFSGLVPALQAGTYDYLAAPTTVTKERADNMLFTEGYLNNRLPVPDQEGRAQGREAGRPERQDHLGQQRARPMIHGRAISKPRSAGRSRASGRRATPCKPCSPAAPTPTSPATPTSPGR